MHLPSALLSKISARTNLKAQLVQARVQLQLATRGEDDVITATLVCHGAFEVRLIEPPDASQTGAFFFWIELFDHNRQVSIDSGGSDVLGEAVIAAEHLITQSKELSKNPHQA
jgi:hypothetical protein